MVYEDAEKLYAEVKKDGEAMFEEAIGVIFGQEVKPFTQATMATGGQIVAYNTTSFARRDIIEVPLTPGKRAQELLQQVAQVSVDGSTGYALMDGSQGTGVARPIGMFADCMPVSGEFDANDVDMGSANIILVFTNGADHLIMRNAGVQLTISNGRITSLLDVQLE
jgi:alpha-mannosidase